MTYYIIPANTYKGETDLGFGFFIGAGKEWWISDDLALAVIGFFGFSNFLDKGSSDITITSTTFGVAFSAIFQ
jgi:hypothetical protein